MNKRLQHHLNQNSLDSNYNLDSSLNQKTTSHQKSDQNPDQKIDPLYVIFEQHLFGDDDLHSDRQQFVEKVSYEYLVEMRKMGLLVPSEWESHVLEEICLQVGTMLTKKIYGCLSIAEYLSDKNMAPKVRTARRKKAEKAYSQVKRSIRRVSKSSSKTRKKAA